MDIHNSVMDIHDLIMDIHNLIMDVLIWIIDISIITGLCAFGSQNRHLFMTQPKLSS